MAGNEPTFQELRRGPRNPNQTHDLAQRLRLLATQAETPTARQEIEAALACPWWGLRELAIRAIGEWGGKANRAWLTERARRPLADYGVMFRRPRGAPEKWQYLETVACREAVVRLLTAEDAEWVLDLWFDGFGSFSGLHGAISRFPLETVRERIRSEMTSPDRQHREAVLWLVFNSPNLGMSEEAYRILGADPDRNLAALAVRLAGMEAHRKANPEMWGLKTASAPPAERSRSSARSAPRS